MSAHQAGPKLKLWSLKAKLFLWASLMQILIFYLIKKQSDSNLEFVKKKS